MGRDNAKHFAIVTVLVILSSVLVYYFLDNVGLFPVQASAEALIIDQLLNIHLLLISFLFSLIMVVMGYSLVVFRHRKGQPEEGVNFSNNTSLEAAWTIIPLGIVIGLSYFGAIDLADILKPAADPLVVNVTASQWDWSFQYPATGVTSPSLNLPINKQTLLRMTSKDVIHGFYVPEFRLQQDILPGAAFVKELRFTPNRLGKYEVLCNQLCGGAHAYMTAFVNVMTQEDFDNWQTQQVSQILTDPVARGQKWAENNGCLGCHTIDGKTSVGPTWKGIYGSNAIWIDGSSHTVDDNYINNAILHPDVQGLKGFSSDIMPRTYSKDLTGDQISDIIAFIKSLK
jgi:cytochrome c oxidase subunit II